MKLSLALAAALAASAEAGLLRQRQLGATSIPCYNPDSSPDDGSNCNNQVLSGEGATTCRLFAVKKKSKGKDNEDTCTLTCKEEDDFDNSDGKGPAKGQDKQGGPVLSSATTAEVSVCSVIIDGLMTDFDDVTQCTNFGKYMDQNTCKPAYCSDPFCYVEEGCNTASPSSFFNGVDGLIFSYDTCGGSTGGTGNLPGCKCINSAEILERDGDLCDFNGADTGAETNGCGCLPTTYGSDVCALHSLDEPGCK